MQFPEGMHLRVIVKNSPQHRRAAQGIADYEQNNILCVHQCLTLLYMDMILL